MKEQVKAGFVGICSQDISTRCPRRDLPKQLSWGNKPRACRKNPASRERNPHEGASQSRLHGDLQPGYKHKIPPKGLAKVAFMGKQAPSIQPKNNPPETAYKSKFQGDFHFLAALQQTQQCFSSAATDSTMFFAALYQILQNRLALHLTKLLIRY